MTDELPPHVENTVRAVSQLHADHIQKATPVERGLDRITALFGNPAFLGMFTVFIGLWIGANLALERLGVAEFDPPPFPRLEEIIAFLALYMAALILTTQRRADRLASNREQMTLELAHLSEQKLAKIIALIEELRRDSPNIKDRIDREAHAMAKPADSQAMHEAILDSHEDITAAAGANANHPPRTG